MAAVKPPIFEEELSTPVLGNGELGCLRPRLRRIEPAFDSDRKRIPNTRH